MSLTVTTAASSQNLTTLDAVKGELGIVLSNTESDAALTRMIGAVSAQIASALGIVLGKETVTEKLSPVDRRRLLLTRTPIISVSQVRLDGVALTSDDWEIEDRLQGSLFREVAWRAGIPLLATASLTLNPERDEELWAVDYIGGYWLPSFTGSPGASDVLLPPEIEQVAIDLATMLFRARGRDPGLKSESIGDYSYTLRDGQTQALTDIVARYGRIATS